ncbi:hypothetical protein [Paraglaciecola agarilytica]|uniref:hypothetical protein n=1 Tax=Paraglaciecola chathamensis TaxID=368405 RepID=UPI0023527684|nr:hypothetical protein [Paraglaciecola agarilytica]
MSYHLISIVMASHDIELIGEHISLISTKPIAQISERILSHFVSHKVKSKGT